MRPLPHVLLSVFLSMVAFSDEETLERAEKLLGANEETDCRTGTDLCVRENNVAAVELLLEVLRQEADRGLPVAHYRDVVWGGLAEIKDVYARGRVELELQKNKKSAWVRQWCAELLGEYGSGDYLASLTEALGDKDIGVRQAAARALARLEPVAKAAPATEKALVNLTRDKDPILRANALEALARRGLGDGKVKLLGALGDEDAGVRTALLAVAGELWPEEIESHVKRALVDPDWRPRLQAVDVCAGLRSTSSIRLLIDALADTRPAVLVRAERALAARTGEKFTRREAWEQWWKDNEGSFDPAKKRSSSGSDEERSSAATFNGIVFESDHAAFLIDVSQTMGETLKTRSMSKHDAAQQELADTFTRLLALPTKSSISVFVYNDETEPFSKKGPVELNEKSREKALAFVGEHRLGGNKNIWQALEDVLADPSIDTVFLLSSGEPEVGTYVHWNRVVWHLKDLNRFRKLVVHAVAYNKEKGYRDHLEQIASSTGGDFVWFE
jgi:HEAT repeat protein